MPALRIVSYNVRYFGHALRGIASTRGAMSRIAQALVALDPLPDIICLQEVETDSLRATIAHRKAHPDETQLDRLMRHLGAALKDAGRPESYDAYYFPAHTYRLTSRTRIYTTGLAILARQDVTIDHHNAGDPCDITHRAPRVHAVRRLKQTRICAHLRLRHQSGDSIDVFNTHLSLPTALSRHFWTGVRRMGYGPNQLEEAKNLVRFIAAQRASDRYLVVGDFNSLPGSPVYRFLLQDHGLSDPFAAVQQLDEPALRAWPTAGFMNLRMHLDHVLCGPGLCFTDFDDSHPFGARLGRFHGLSDHVPLIGRCRVRNSS